MSTGQVHQAGRERRAASRIVVGTDGSDTATEAVRQATELARSTGAALTVVSACEPGSELRLRREREQVPGELAHMVTGREQAHLTLSRAAELADDGGVQVRVEAREGDAADLILDVAEEERADLIVVGSKGMTGAKRFLLGSVPDKVSHHAPCSVLIVRTT